MRINQTKSTKNVTAVQVLRKTRVCSVRWRGGLQLPGTGDREPFGGCQRVWRQLTSFRCRCARREELASRARPCSSGAVRGACFCAVVPNSPGAPNAAESRPRGNAEDRHGEANADGGGAVRAAASPPELDEEEPCATRAARAAPEDQKAHSGGERPNDAACPFVCACRICYSPPINDEMMLISAWWGVFGAVQVGVLHRRPTAETLT